MADPIEIRVPDIGGYDDVPVIEVLVSVGDSVALDQGLVTLESDKATMEVPASAAGTVREVKVKVGDTVSEGTLIAVLEAGSDGGEQDKDPDQTKQKGKQEDGQKDGQKNGKEGTGAGTGAGKSPLPRAGESLPRTRSGGGARRAAVGG